MALWPGPKDSTFWFDFEGLTDGNLWPDKGPYGLHATPQAGFAAPNYGLARNAHGKGYANFTGAANCYATMPLRFYQYAPTAEQTWVSVSRLMIVGDSYLFAAAALGASNYGIMHYLTTGAANGSRLWGMPGNAGLNILQGNEPVMTGRTYTTCLAFSGAALSRINGAATSTSWVAGGYAPVVYDAAVVPAFGKYAAALLTGHVMFLALFPFRFTHSEAKAMSAWLMDQV